MKQFLLAAMITMTLIVFATSAMRSDGTRYTTTVERVIQPAASVQLEAQQLAAQTERARMDAERTERRDFYVFVGALTFAGMIVLLMFVWLFTRRPQVVTLQLPANTPPHLIEAQWRVIDEQMQRTGYELESRR